MGLRSELLKKDRKLQTCLVSDPAHVLEGAAGDHVCRIQTALLVLGGPAIQDCELVAKHYGPSTAAAVLAFKKKRQIINRAYQTNPDDIVGKMTIAALDKELLQKEAMLSAPQKPFCGNDHGSAVATVRGSQKPTMLIAAAVNEGVAFRLAPDVAQSNVADASSPQTLALARVTDAKNWVAQTRSTLRRVLDFWPSQPAGSRDKIWRHFGMPEKFPLSGPFLTSVKSLLDFVLSLDKTFQKVSINLEAAKSLFRNADLPWFPEPTVPAFTVDDDRDPRDPPKVPQWPNGVYFQPQFVGLGEKKKTEVVLHEAVHSLSTHEFRDVAKPGTLEYRELGSNFMLNNAWSYSTFILDCVLNRSMPLDPKE